MSVLGYTRQTLYSEWKFKKKNPIYYNSILLWTNSAHIVHGSYLMWVCHFVALHSRFLLNKHGVENVINQSGYKSNTEVSLYFREEGYFFLSSLNRNIFFLSKHSWNPDTQMVASFLSALRVQNHLKRLRSIRKYQLGRERK